MSKNIVSTILLGFAYLLSVGQSLTGIVYSDENKNNIKDIGEKGIQGVALSNGKDIVLTDKEGLYIIPAPTNTVIFVIKPEHYTFPLNEKNISQNFILNYPNGSQKLKYKGVVPTGKVPARIDFALYPKEESDNFKTLFFGDTQPYSLENIDYFENDIIADIPVSKDYLFTSVLGDIVGDHLDLYPPLTGVMSKLKMPVYYVQGNHDMNYDVTHDSLTSETFKSVFGPKNYAFNYGKVHFIVLDNTIYSGDSITRNYKEGFDEEAITFLRNDLQYVPKEKLIVVMMHAPFLNEINAAPIINLEKVLQLLSPFQNTFSISGHNHTISQQLITDKYGWSGKIAHHHFNTGATCGDWYRGRLDSTGIPDATMRDGSPNGYAIIEFTGNTYRVSYKAARKPADYQMNVYCPKVVKQNSGWGNWSAGEMYINFFTGSPNDTVKFRVDKGEWIAMKYTLEPDPSYCDIRALWDHASVLLIGERPSNPENCPHLWKSSLPAWLNEGPHSIEIEATDIFNRKFTAFHTYQIAK